MKQEPEVLIPIPESDFDPTEVAIPWRMLTKARYKVHFVTPEGRNNGADPLMLTGRRLGPWKRILMAGPLAVEAYRQLEKDPSFIRTGAYESVNPERYAAILLPGGHAPGIRTYLESKKMQGIVGEFFKSNKPVAAICHGVVLAARSGCLRGRKTTCLLESQEMTAWWMTRWWLGDYYRTYPETVEREVRNALAQQSDFLPGPTPLFRDDPAHMSRGFVVSDGNYISARWPGDSHRFGDTFIKKLIEVYGEV